MFNLHCNFTHSLAARCCFPLIPRCDSMEACCALFPLNSIEELLWVVYSYTAFLLIIYHVHCSRHIVSLSLLERIQRFNITVCLPEGDQLEVLSGSVQYFHLRLMQVCTEAVPLMCVHPQGQTTAPNSSTVDVRDGTVCLRASPSRAGRMEYDRRRKGGKQEVGMAADWQLSAVSSHLMHVLPGFTPSY